MKVFGKFINDGTNVYRIEAYIDTTGKLTETCNDEVKQAQCLVSPCCGCLAS